MPYNATKYQQLRALGVERDLARQLADNNSPIPSVSQLPTKMPAIADLAGGADLPTTVAKVNALLAALRTAGYLAP